MQNKKDNSVVTLILIASLIFCRIIAESIGLANVTVLLINIAALLYVVYCIYNMIKENIQKVNNKRIYNLRCKTLKRYIFIFTGFIILLCIIFVLAYKNQTIYEVSGCINDIIAIISLGISIEDNFIISKATEYFNSLT